MQSIVYRHILDRQREGEPAFAVLIDPDDVPSASFDRTLGQLKKTPPDYVFVGGSLSHHDSMEQCIAEIKATVSVPVLLFPGSTGQIEAGADALLFLSLISGRNPEYLIGQQIKAAPMIRRAGLETISTGYMLVGGGRATTAHYVSQSLPIPADKPEIAVHTALAGEMLGFQCLYLDAGSGAEQPVPVDMIRAVRAAVAKPLIVGGGIVSPEHATEAIESGADIVVVGNAIQSDVSLIDEIRHHIKNSGKII